MKTIPSFQKNHDVLEKGLYLCGETQNVYTYDLRFKKPNGGNYISPKALHSIEHMLATILRNSASGEKIVYFGPMGCRTGFYLLVFDMGLGEVKSLIEAAIEESLSLDCVPGSAKRECGNYLEHDLEGAKRELAAYLDVLEGA